ncbi:MAG: U32 family peptidase [Candidatus Margulisiibacteriota bacterium]|jgi:collagenase-like PrtC family protease
MEVPKLITYADSKKLIKVAIDSGVTHLILEDPSFSLKCFTNRDYPKIGEVAMRFNKADSLQELAVFARRLKKNIELSTVIDFLAKPDDFPKIKNFLQKLKSIRIKLIRVQDLGLVKFIKDHYPEAEIIFIHETANVNLESVKFVAQFVKIQTLSPLLSIKDLRVITKSVQHNFEYLVQGDLFLHYSDKKFITDFMRRNQKKRPYFLEDTDNPKRLFPIKETKNNFFVLNYFQRSLLKYLEELASLNLSGLIIDVRSEPKISHVRQILTAYYNFLIGVKSNSGFQIEKVNLKFIRLIFFAAVKKISRIIKIFHLAAAGLFKKKLKVFNYLGTNPNKKINYQQGFFHSNLFDNRSSNNYEKEKLKGDYLGFVLDTVAKKWLVVELIKSIKVNDQVKTIDPEEKIYQFQVSLIKNLNQDVLQKAVPGEIVLLKINGKNIAPKSILCSY